MKIIEKIFSSRVPREINVCVVAVLKDEDPFIDEWLVYHRLLGIDHFYLYDNDPGLPLKELTKHHTGYVTVIDWPIEHDDQRYPGRTKQIKAYTHFLNNFSDRHEWVAFIDVDEFIVLRKHHDIKSFLRGFEKFDAVSLNWHVFGHNGYYEDPTDLVTSSLTKRMYRASKEVKTITKAKSIISIKRAHCCVLESGCIQVDANKKKFKTKMYPGKTKVAHINHYQCRSFKRWMLRPVRKEVGCVSGEKGHDWRFDKEICLRRFIEDVAKDKNEFEDTYMFKYVPKIKEYLAAIRLKNNSDYGTQYK